MAPSGGEEVLSTRKGVSKAAKDVGLTHLEQQWSGSGPSTTQLSAQHVVFQRSPTRTHRHELVVAQKDACLDMEIAELSASLPAAADVGGLLKP